MSDIEAEVYSGDDEKDELPGLAKITGSNDESDYDTDNDSEIDYTKKKKKKDDESEDEVNSEEESSDEEESEEEDIDYDSSSVVVPDEKCYQKYDEKKKISFENKDLQINHNKWREYTIVDNEDRISGNKMTKYEYSRCLGIRKKQLLGGAPPMIDPPKNLDYEQIAKLELINKKSPLIILRPLPGLKIEKFTVQELEISDILTI